MHHLAKNCARAGLCVLFAALSAALFAGAAQAAPSAVFPDKYAAIVIDANTGRVLFAAKPDMRRYPASLTKMMTLYLLFDAMKSGRVSARTAMPVSVFANSQPPTKLNLGAGQRIGAEDAAKALITKSANDVAVAIAEYLGGTEKNFARMMTAQARRLGMRNTNFANASGLPNLRNYSTARDLAILALALRRDFPRQYALFSTTSFYHGGRFIRGHNRLVAHMAGVDGIKTGYTQMSGFNLASSRRMGNKSIVAVVMGGKTSALRDSHMAGLLTRYMDKAGSKRGFGFMTPAAPGLMASAELHKPYAPAAAEAAALPLAAADIPVPTAKMAVNAAAAPADISAVLAQGSDDAEEDEFGAMPIPQVSPAEKNAADAPPMSDRERDSAMLMMLASQPDAAGASAQQSLDQIITASLPAQASVQAPAPKAPPRGRRGWVIQLAAAANRQEAERIMGKTARAVRRRNAGAQPYIEAFSKRGKIYYRVRYRGFADKEEARASCAKLKKSGYQCLAAAL